MRLFPACGLTGGPGRTTRDVDLIRHVSFPAQPLPRIASCHSRAMRLDSGLTAE
jgi:hypothetical protein